MDVGSIRRIQSAAQDGHGIRPLQSPYRITYAVDKARRALGNVADRSARINSRKPHTRKLHRAPVHGIDAVRSVIGIRIGNLKRDHRVHVEIRLLAETIADDLPVAETYAQRIVVPVLPLHRTAPAQHSESAVVTPDPEIGRTQCHTRREDRV